MKQLASALVKAQQDRTPEGRMMEASLLKQLFHKKGTNQHTSPKDMLTRFMSHVVFGASDCWYWIGYQDPFGYGRFTYPNENKAHRAAYRMFVGEVPSGMKVLHKCDTRCCVNPEHLFVGTQADNVHDMVAKKRNKNIPLHGERNPMSKLTRQQVDEIRSRVASGETQRSMCKVFNVSPMTVSRIIRKELWK
jgi:hypothetical protein